MTAEPITYPAAELTDLDQDPLFAEWRGQGGLARVRLPFGEPAWLATRYEDVKLVLGDPRFSRAASEGRDEPRVRPLISQPGSILSMDPPEHSRLRRLVMKAFTVKRIEQLRPRAQEIADGLADAMLAAGPPRDLVEEFALPLPVTVICELLGVPYEDRGDFRHWSDAFLSTTRYTPEEVGECAVKMRDYMAGLIHQRRQSTKDDLLSELVAARDEGDRLTEDELLSLGQAILVAGHETTASQIPNFVYVLLQHPDQLRIIQEDPKRIPQAVEELMRFVPLGIGGGIPRYALEDVQVGATLVKAGEPVMPSIVSANQDASVYHDPGTLDLLRAEASHVGFGHGPHHCLGAPLARMELQVAVGTLFSRLPNLRLLEEAEDPITWKKGLSTRGPERMMVTWDA
jgi:cytochrome P450